MRALEEVCAYARAAGLLVIADGKRGDIGSTARAYAAAYLEPARVAAARRRADRQPVPRPRLARAVPRRLPPRRGGLFCLVKTSNAGGADIQDLALSDGQPLWQHVARLVAEWGEELVGERGLSSVGAVVGATHPRAVGEARRLLPQAILLLPGVGAQGAGPADVARAFTSGPASALVTASRSVIYAFRSTEDDWRAAAAAEAARLKSEVWVGLGLVGMRLARRSEAVRAPGRVPPARDGRRARRPRRALTASLPAREVGPARPARPRSPSSPPALAAGPSVHARAYLVENGRTGEVLLAHNPGERVPIASITKLMTVLVALEHARLNDVVTVSPEAAAVGES